MSKLVLYGQKRADVKRHIQHLLDVQGQSFADVARAAGVSRQTVSATMNGFRHSPRVLEALRQLGIPEEFLFDPRRNGFA